MVALYVELSEGMQEVGLGFRVWVWTSTCGFGAMSARVWGPQRVK